MDINILIDKYIKNDFISFYHVSNPYYRNKIFEEGLVPQIGDSYELHYEEDSIKMGKAIFICLDNTYNSTYDDDRYKIILSKADLLRLDLKVDNDVENSFYTNKPIEKEFLTLIYLGTQNLDKDWILESNNKLLIEKNNIYDMGFN